MDKGHAVQAHEKQDHEWRQRESIKSWHRELSVTARVHPTAPASPQTLQVPWAKVTAQFLYSKDAMTRSS